MFKSGGAFEGKAWGSIQQDLQHNYPNLGTTRIGHSTLLLEIEITCDVQHWANAHTKRYTPDSADTEMMNYCDHDERERKQMYHSSGRVRIYRAGPDESDKSGGSSGGSGGSGGGDGGSGSGDNDEDADTDADTNKLDYNYN